MKEFICALCGEAIDEMDDDYDELADGRLVCIPCYRSKCKRCIGCNELFPKEDMTETEIDEYCCSSCYDESISVCDGCGKIDFELFDDIYQGSMALPGLLQAA